MKPPSPISRPTVAGRLRGLPWARVAGIWVPVADDPIGRLLGLALLPAERAGPGLLLPRCRAVHTFGMRFSLRVMFLDDRGEVLREVPTLAPGRLARCPRASATLELVSPRQDFDGGESRTPAS